MTFYKETDFQETPIGRFPKEWNVARLEDICEKVRAGGTPLTSKKEYWNGDLAFVKIEDITLAGKYLTETKSFISKEGLNNSSAWLVPENSLLFAMYGSMGEVSINKIPVTTNQAILGIIPQDRDDVEFFYYWYSFFKPRWKKYAKPTTQANLTAEILRDSMIPLPSQKERRGIVGVLGVVDSVIAKTGEVIAKTERLKKGLMQTLLTRGIGHKEYKQTPIGTTPKTWQIARLGEISEVIMGQSPPGETYNEKGEGTPLINGPTEFGEKYPIKSKWTTSLTKLSKENDVFICVRGHTTGRLNISDGAYCLGRGVAAIRGIEQNISNTFLYYVLEENQNKIFQRSYAAGSTFPNVTREELGRVQIPIPPIEEQRQISGMLGSIDKKLELEKKEKSKLERIKQGLMDLLLTGKIRVKED